MWSMNNNDEISVDISRHEMLKLFEVRNEMMRS